MPGTKAGAAKAKETIKQRYSEDFWSNIGKIGGKNGTGHTFAHGAVDPAEAGKIGGRISRRGKRDRD